MSVRDDPCIGFIAEVTYKCINAKSKQEKIKLLKTSYLGCKCLIGLLRTIADICSMKITLELDIKITGGYQIYGEKKEIDITDSIRNFSCFKIDDIGIILKIVRRLAKANEKEMPTFVYDAIIEIIEKIGDKNEAKVTKTVFEGEKIIPPGFYAPEEKEVKIPLRKGEVSEKIDDEDNLLIEISTDITIDIVNAISQ